MSASFSSGSALPERRIENLIGPYPCVLWPQHRVVGRPFEESRRAEVEHFGHRVLSFIGDNRVGAGEEALRGPHQSDRTSDVSHPFGGRTALQHRRRVLFGGGARGFGPVSAFDLL